jgi:hypothetical protein
MDPGAQVADCSTGLLAGWLAGWLAGDEEKGWDLTKP